MIQKLEITLSKKVGEALHKYKMLDGNNTIVVAMSGGKDSFALLDLLYKKRKYLKIKYDLVAVHIDFGIDEIEVKNILDFCERRSVQCIIHKENLKIEENRMINCFYCSWIRRTALFKFMKEFGFKKLALGHHMNDAVETLFLNLFYQSKFESFIPNTKFFNGEFNLIRPLILCKNSDIKKYAILNNFPIQNHKCPYGIISQRNKIRKVLEKIDKKNDKILTNIFASLEKNID